MKKLAGKISPPFRKTKTTMIAIFKKETPLKLIFALSFVLIGIVSRLLPHPPNFTPLTAIALFSGTYLTRKTALLIPLTTMIFSDLILKNYYDLPVMASVYGSFLAIALLGLWLKNHKRWGIIGATTILSSLLFFTITNFAVWAFTPWYAKNLSGLTQCYLLALPFLKNTLLGDIFYTGCLFGFYELAVVRLKEKLTIARAKKKDYHRCVETVS